MREVHDTGIHRERAEQAVRTLIEYVGENPDRNGLADTPMRVIEAWDEMFEGYAEKPEDILARTFEDVKADEIVLLKEIEFFSICEHHLLPFYGQAHIAYIPADGGNVVGISKLARLLEIYSRRMQIQERICDQVTTAVMEHLKAKGAACIIEARHLCICMRGVGKQNAIMSTSSMKGAFKENEATRMELLSLIKG